MNRDEFFDAIRKAAIQSNAFDLDGDGDECYSLSFRDNHWIVYYSERGFETNVATFKSESAALDYLFDTLKNDHAAHNVI